MLHCLRQLLTSTSNPFEDHPTYDRGRSLAARSDDRPDEGDDRAAKEEVSTAEDVRQATRKRKCHGYCNRVCRQNPVVVCGWTCIARQS